MTSALAVTPSEEVEDFNEWDMNYTFLTRRIHGYYPYDYYHAILTHRPLIFFAVIRIRAIIEHIRLLS